MSCQWAWPDFAGPVGGTQPGQALSKRQSPCRGPWPHKAPSSPSAAAPWLLFQAAFVQGFWIPKMLCSGIQLDFSDAASTWPVSAAQGVQEGSWPKPGQVFEPRHHFPDVSIRQKTNTAFVKGWEQNHTVRMDSSAWARWLTQTLGTLASPTRSRLGAWAGSIAVRSAPGVRGLPGPGGAPCTGTNLQQTGFAPRADSTPHLWFTSPHCICINAAIAICGYSFT